MIACSSFLQDGQFFFFNSSFPDLSFAMPGICSNTNNGHEDREANDTAHDNHEISIVDREHFSRQLWYVKICCDVR